MDKFNKELKAAKNPWVKRIGNYLLSRDDIKTNLEKENKSLDECFQYILNELANKAKKNQQNGVGFVSGDDEELYTLAVHYYDEDDLKVRKENHRTNADNSASYSQLQAKMEHKIPNSNKSAAKMQQKEEKVVKTESNKLEKENKTKSKRAKSKVNPNQIDIFSFLGDENV